MINQKTQKGEFLIIVVIQLEELRFGGKCGGIFIKYFEITIKFINSNFFKSIYDVNVEVTDIVNMWITGQEENYGMLVRFNGVKTDETTFGHLKFFSRNTHTIFHHD